MSAWLSRLVLLLIALVTLAADGNGCCSGAFRYEPARPDGFPDPSRADEDPPPMPRHRK